MNRAKTNKYINNSIDLLNLDRTLKEALVNQGITTVGKVWILKRKDLKDFGLSDTDINQIIIKLQLLGLDLNKKVY